MATKRKDKNHIVLKKGETYREGDKRYSYRWTDSFGKRHSVYSKTLDQLRKKEAEIVKDITDGIRPESSSVTLNDIFEIWKDTKRGLKETTIRSYHYTYSQYIESSLGEKPVNSIKKSDIKRFYNDLTEKQGYGINTINRIQSVLHQIFSVAVDDCYIRLNPSNGTVSDLKKSRNLAAKKRKALTLEEEKIFLNFVKSNTRFSRWYSIFVVMLNTGMRVGEATGLRWQDVDFGNNVISVNHTLVYSPNSDGKFVFSISDPKTEASVRSIPMLRTVRDILLRESATRTENTEFIFTNRAGNPHYQTALNDAINNIVRTCNEEYGYDVLPHFSCHTLRHTFATRMCERGVNMKVIQDILGHTDISITMNIYTDATNDMKRKAFQEFDDTFNDTKVDTNYAGL